MPKQQKVVRTNSGIIAAIFQDLKRTGQSLEKFMHGVSRGSPDVAKRLGVSQHQLRKVVKTLKGNDFHMLNRPKVEPQLPKRRFSSLFGAERTGDGIAYNY